MLRISGSCSGDFSNDYLFKRRCDRSEEILHVGASRSLGPVSTMIDPALQTRFNELRPDRDTRHVKRSLVMIQETGLARLMSIDAP